jgi:outer membrane protein assembly factor BamB
VDVWDRRTGDKVNSFQGIVRPGRKMDRGSAQIFSCFVDTSREIVALGGYTVAIRNYMTGELLVDGAQDVNGTVYGLTGIPSLSRVYAAGQFSPKAVVCWDVAKKSKLFATETGFGKTISALAATDTHKVVVAGDREGNLTAVHSVTGEILWQVRQRHHLCVLVCARASCWPT